MGDEEHWVKPDQVEAMRAAAREGRHPRRDDAIITLLYDTGLRRGEPARVDREMLDLEDELLRLPTSVQKDYPNDSTPPPVTFELDRDDSLRTVTTLQEFLEARVDDDPALVFTRTASRGEAAPTTSPPTHSATASPGGCCGSKREYTLRRPKPSPPRLASHD